MPVDYWRDVAGYPGYQVSWRGEVRTLKRNKLLAQAQDARGYRHVNLYRGGRPRNFLVHRLVAAAFIAPIPFGQEVNHKDGQKDHNDVSNLEIVTPEQNRLHAKQEGLIRRGEDNPRSKLTEQDVRTIRALREDGVRVRDISWMYDVTERTVYCICNRKLWRHVA